MDTDTLKSINRRLRKIILSSTTHAGSGHPSSSLSAVELMSALFFGHSDKKKLFHFDSENPKNHENDRFILSKGHASPLLYALYSVAGVVSEEELSTLRMFGSRLEGHPTPRFPYADVATGSLGQGLSIGLGMTIGMRVRPPKTNVFVLLGDSEIAEGQIWEAMELASYYKVSNLIGIVDVNRLGQRGETLLGWNLRTYKKRAEAFGWEVYIIEDGHNIENIIKTYEQVLSSREDKPKMIFAKTIKGKGVSFIENKNGNHGKPLTEDELKKALAELEDSGSTIHASFHKPESQKEVHKKLKSISSKIATMVGLDEEKSPSVSVQPHFKKSEAMSTRRAYGEAVATLGTENKAVVALDAEVSNSTYANIFAQKLPERFFEMFIAEQNMISTAVGISSLGLIPFASSFGAFLTRGFDQIRMAQYSHSNIKLVGSHVGVSIGPDGPSQMALEDIAMMRAIQNSVVLYPADAISTGKLVREMAKHEGIAYLRTTRATTPLLYSEHEEFPIGGCKILRQSVQDKAVVIAAGITLHEALKAYEEMKESNIFVTVVDLYSIKPLDETRIKKLVEKVKKVVVVEDHYAEGGIGEALQTVLPLNTVIVHLAVRKLPRSGSSEELLRYEEIDKNAIISALERIC